MSIKDILLHADSAESYQNRINAAVELAESHDAHLTGLYVIRDQMPMYAEAQLPASILEAQLAASRAAADDAQALFEESAEKAGLQREWRCVEGQPARLINLHARYSDLLVMGQSDDGGFGLMNENLCDQVVIESGRPVLVVPYIGIRSSMGRHIHVAWNGSRESVRAINDALPLLARAEDVKVIAINADSGPRGHGEIPCADICLHLARHGVNAEACNIIAGDLEVGDTLLSRAMDLGADMLVMGAYGHSRFREFVLGGATRHLLRHMTIPVVLSH